MGFKATHCSSERTLHILLLIQSDREKKLFFDIWGNIGPSKKGGKKKEKKKRGKKRGEKRKKRKRKKEEEYRATGMPDIGKYRALINIGQYSVYRTTGRPGSLLIFEYQF